MSKSLQCSIIYLVLLCAGRDGIGRCKTTPPGFFEQVQSLLLLQAPDLQPPPVLYDRQQVGDMYHAVLLSVFLLCHIIRVDCEVFILTFKSSLTC